MKRIAIASFVMLLGTTASAADKPPSTEMRADQLFKSGAKKFDGGDLAGACVDFAESLRLGPKLGTLLNLALCHEQTGKLVTAWNEFTHGAAWAAQNGQRDRVDFAREHVRALEPKLPRVVLQLPVGQAIASLELDGEPLPEPRWYLPLYLDAGQHELAVHAPGHERTPVAFRVNAAPGDQLVSVPAPAATTAAPAKAVARTTTTAPDHVPALGIAGLGLGALGLLVGTVYGIRAIAADERDPAVHSYATTATLSGLAGAAFATAGAVVVWRDRDRRVAVSAGGLSGAF